MKHWHSFAHPARLLCRCMDGPEANAGGATVASAAAVADMPGFDRRVRCQDDLYGSANGQWLATTHIAADKSHVSSFTALKDQTDQRLHAIVEGLAASSPPAGTPAERVSRFYAAYMHTDAIDAAGLAPLSPLLAQIDAITTPRALAQWQGQMQGCLNTPISLWVAADFAQPDRYRALLWQGGLGLPDKDYFLKPDDARLAHAHAAYASYLQNLLMLLGEPDAASGAAAAVATAAAAAAQRVLALEHRIAQLHWDQADNRDPEKINNPVTLDDLVRRVPGFEWSAFMQAAKLGHVNSVCLSQPSALIGLAQLMAEVPLADWRLYFKLHVVDDAAATLPQAFRDAHFAFRGAVLNGASAPQPRWQLAIAEVNRALGDDVGQLYVDKHFSPAHKARVHGLVDHLLAAFDSAIDELPWMTAATRAEAQHKLSQYSVKLGYPSAWRDFSRLQVDADDAVGNTQRAARFEWQRLAEKVGHKVDRDEWALSPQTVNAYYNPSLNEIVFPAAILQAPFFDIEADEASNYGAMGAIIGHEISHGFDDQGSKFDGDGALRNWWSPADRQAFDDLTAQLVAQYNTYEALPGCRVNGQLTLGENIADVSGLQIAFKAYLRATQGQADDLIDGHNGAQRFFVSWARAWREKVREPRARQLLSIDPHAPGEFRANGAALNHPGFHVAFATQAGDKMFRPSPQQIRIW
jgi:putative endopeptidase